MKKWKFVCICLAVSLLASFTVVFIKRAHDNDKEEATESTGLYCAGANTEEGWGEIITPN